MKNSKPPKSSTAAKACFAGVASLLAITTANAADVTGALLHEYWSGKTRTDIEQGIAGPTTVVDTLNAFNTPVNVADNFAERISGYFIPPTTGDYVFFESSDDDSDVFLSTDSTSANKRQITQETIWSNDLEWVSSGGASDLTKKRSDQYTAADGTTPFANGIHLTAGQKYYIEGVHHEGGGGDDFGVTFKLVSEPDPASGDPSRMTGDVIAYTQRNPTQVTITKQPQSITVVKQNSVTFSFDATTDGTSGMSYQWRKNGTNIPDATNPTYTVNGVATTDSGTKYSVVVTAVGGTATATSADATLTVVDGIVAKGFLKREFFGSNPARTDVEAGNAPAPTALTAVPTFESPANVADNYVERVSGFFTPKTTGDYVFFLASDDDSDLFLSTDDSPANKRMIAQESGWSGNRNWITVGGGSLPEQKRSDTFADPNSGESPGANGLHLVAGTSYYIEAVHHEGTGGDDLSATFKLVSEADPKDGDLTRITSDQISFLATPSTITVSQQPQNTSIPVNTTASFSAAGTADNPYGVYYQWQKNGVDIAGATSTNYTTPLLTTADNGAKYTVVISSPGATSVTSQAGVVTVTSDVIPPTLLSAGSLSGSTSVGVAFSELMDPASGGTAANYQIVGATVSAAAVRTTADGTTVELTLSAPLSGSAKLTVNNVKDLAGNPVAANSSVTIGVNNLVSQDIDPTADADHRFDTVNPDPAVPGSAFSTGAGAFDIMASGSDIYNNFDGFRYTYEKKTNDFDVKVQVVHIVPINNWSAGALMVRETLSNDSRDWHLKETPRNVTTKDNSGSGASTIETNRRDTSGGAVAGWLNAVGDHTNPNYPNAWIRLARKDGTFYAYRSDDGINWTLLASEDPSTTGDSTPFPSVVYVGMATTAHNNTPDPAYLTTVTYRNYGDTATSTGGGGTFGPVTIASGQITISWTGSGVLQSADTVNGTWTDVAGAANPYKASAASGMKFYRLR